MKQLYDFSYGRVLQRTGTTIMDAAPDGSITTFAQIDATTLPGPRPGGVGLTTALTVLRTGWVIVGSLPTSGGTSGTAQVGCLLVRDNSGNVVETFSDPMINGPWDMTDSEDGAHLLVTNEPGCQKSNPWPGLLPAFPRQWHFVRRDVDPLRGVLFVDDASNTLNSLN
ncbi:MAG: hypothetical protein DMG41_14340 [Acidobacteria bacterium]|nr:MAG: hypothetical protein AUH13_16290 [Acidobacteria bacterium 13_2_20CM_58_27]PYT87705.1 MAG: hypothetical protein DMG41_14340 [Acidobacteriota bacterium]